MEIEGVFEGDGRTWVEYLWPEEKPAWRVRLAFEGYGGRIRCSGACVLALGPERPFSASSMRRIPIGLLIDEALTHPPKELIELAGLPQFNSLAALRDAGLSLLRQQKPKTSSGRGRPVKYGPEHYAEVARIHSENPGRPTQAVAEAFEVNRTTASNWVRKARELGLTVDLRAAPIRGE